MDQLQEAIEDAFIWFLRAPLKSCSKHRNRAGLEVCTSVCAPNLLTPGRNKAIQDIGMGKYQWQVNNIGTWYVLLY